MTFTAFATFVFALGACVFDLRAERVDNRWILLFWGLGAAAQLARQGPAGLLRFLSGAGPILILLFPLFLFRMLGAGDIKVLSVIGGLLGFRAGLDCLLLSFLCGAAISFLILVKEGILLSRFTYFFAYLGRLLASGKRVPYRREEDVSAMIHFTVPVFLAVLIKLGGKL